MSYFTDVRIVKKTMKSGAVKFYVEVLGNEKWNLMPNYSGIYYTLDEALEYKSNLLNQIVVSEEVVG